MGVVKSIDTFIELSNTLLIARPDTTRVTTTYSHRKVAVPSDAETVKAGVRPAHAIVKTYDPVTGACFKCKITKNNQLSRLMGALGMRGVVVTKSRTDGNPITVRGAASVMAGVEVAYEHEEEVEKVQEVAAETTGGAKKKNKKKGKK